MSMDAARSRSNINHRREDLSKTQCYGSRCREIKTTLVRPMNSYSVIGSFQSNQRISIRNYSGRTSL